MSRSGKISRLPRSLRDELNRRLEQNIPGPTLLRWLNNLPAARKIFRTLFEGKPLNLQNLSDWRHGGFLEWQTRQELLADLRESSHDAASLDSAVPLMADRAAQLISARLLVAARNWNGDPDDPAFAKLQRLSALLRGLSSIRRCDHQAARLQREQDSPPSLSSHSGPRRPAPLSAWHAVHGRSSSPPSSPINPHQASVSTPPPATSTPDYNWLDTIVPTFPSPSSPSSHQSPSSPPSCPASPSAPVPSQNPTPPHPALSLVPPGPLTDTELWQMRSRDLPGDTPPAWRITLPVKTVPPWLQTP